MKKILILSHNPHRDFHSDNFVANELLRRGHCVWLRKFLSNDGPTIATIKPDIIVIPEARVEYTVALAKIAKRFGIRIVMKSCEFGITEESLPYISDDYRTAIFGRIPIGDCVDRVLAWGPKMKQMAERYTDVPAENIICCGGYQFDQYFVPQPEAPKNKKPVLLFATGFAYADRNREYAIPEAAPDSSIHREFVEGDSKKRSVWLNMLKKTLPELAEKWDVIIKPHAGEKPEPYNMILKDLPFQLEMAQTGFQTLLRSDALVHAGSTMAYEAHLLGKPAFNFCNNNQDVVYSKISPQIRTVKELTEALEQVELGKSNADIEVVDKMVSQYWGPVDGKGYMRVADVIEGLPVQRVHEIPDEWPRPTEAKYITPGVYPTALQWHCSGCGNDCYCVQQHREMLRCPFCGIAMVRIPIANPNMKGT